MEGEQKKKVPQIALFKSMSYEKVEKAVNGSLLQTSTLGHTYVSVDIWVEGDVWCGKLEYLVDLSQLIDVDEDDVKKRLSGLKKFRYNPNQTVNELGHEATKALIVQNGLDISLDLDYTEMKTLIYAKTNLKKETLVKEIEVDVEVVEVKFKLNGK
tara:strand:- start:44 stop:511 length:468 start_codon:yes stop_codon:yes gene_type:complete